MFYLFISDIVLGIILSLGLSYYICEDFGATIFLLPFILVILSFLREYEYKIRGRLKAIERKEYVKNIKDYDMYFYNVNSDSKSPFDDSSSI